MSVNTVPKVTGIYNPNSPSPLGDVTPAVGAFTTLKSQGGNVGYVLETYSIKVFPN